MTCPTLEVCASYADDALDAAAAQQFEAHLAGCATCRQRLGVLRAETRALRAAFEVAELSTPTPAGQTLGGASSFAWLGWLLAAAAPLNAAWLSTVAALRLPGWLSWLVPDAASLGAELAVDAAIDAFLPNWSLFAMLQHPIFITTLIALVGVVLLWRARRPGPDTHLLLALLAGTLLLFSSEPAAAFELKRSEDRIVIGADETIDDSAALIGDSILVEGTINGDLLAIADRVVLRGTVTGMVITFGDDIEISGRVGGSLIQAGNRAVLDGVEIAGNWFGAGETLALTTDSRVDGNAAVAGERIELDGNIGRDLYSAAEQLAVAGAVQRSVRAAAERVTLTETASIGGDLKLRADPDRVQGQDLATIGGTVDFITREAEEDSGPGVESLLFVVLKLLAALLTGWLLFRVAPGLRQVDPGAGSDGLVTLAIGLAMLIGMPLAAVVITLTLIGAPLGIALGVLWIALCYLAGIIAARWVGTLLLTPERYGLVLQLLVGLLLIAVLSAIPILGSAVGVLTTLLGLGLFGRWLYEVRAAVI